MLGNFPPFTTMQELNLDWILTKIKNILRFVPDDGAVGQILRRTPSGAEWSNEQGGGGAVNSVNGQTGDVVLTAADVGALPDTYVAPVTSVNGQTGAVALTIPDSTSDLVNDSGFVDAAGAAAAAPVQSVNGQTGSVSLTIPDSTSDLVNDSGFVNSAGAAAAAPVQSVNGQTGSVTVPAYNEYLQSGDVIYIRSSYRPACCFTTSCSVIIPIIKRVAAGTTFTVSINGQSYVRLNGIALSNVTYREIEYRDNSNELVISFNLTGGTNFVPCIVSFEATITVN